ncbi:YbbR-like domain-containing protein [Solibacillus daqui]|uniref:CdaR family protein n=1 Tax=Solibacillus daqui TaxID=2912187 RepID=UPI002365B0F6|nr:CdaR family protein [Solibacillus daqui]
MDKLFDSPWMLRLTALFLALALFLYIQIEEKRMAETGSSNETDVITNVPLEVYYDHENLFVTGLPDTVDVKVSGSSAIVMKTKLEKDFKVFVDLNSLAIGEHSVTIQQENFSEKLNVSIDPKFVNVKIEEKITEEFRVEPEMNNRLVKDDFIVKSMTIQPTRVSITGAKSVIDSISYVKATVTGDKGIEKSFEQQATVKVLDRDLNKLDVQVNPEKVNVKVDISEYSRELPITLKETGELPEGVTIEKLSLVTSKVTVYGKKTAIDALKEVVVEVDRAQLKESGSYDFKITLPTGATKLSQDQLTIHADVINESVSEEENVSKVDAEVSTDETEGN